MTGRPILRLKKPREPEPTPAPAPPLAPAAYVAPTPLRIGDILAELAPLFEPVGERMLPRFPYAIGIADALTADPRFRPGDDPAASHALVRNVIARVTGTGAYLRSLARPGAMRHDINGAPVEAVSASHCEHALRLLADREKKRDRHRPTPATGTPRGCERVLPGRLADGWRRPRFPPVPRPSIGGA